MKWLKTLVGILIVIVQLVDAIFMVRRMAWAI